MCDLYSLNKLDNEDLLIAFSKIMPYQVSHQLSNAFKELQNYYFSFVLDDLYSFYKCDDENLYLLLVRYRFRYHTCPKHLETFKATR